MNNPMTYRLTGTLFALCFSIALFGQWEDQANWEYFVNPEQINDVIEQGDHFWFATNKGVVDWNKTEGVGTYYYEYNSGIPSAHISTIALSADGKTWIGTYDNMLAVFDGGEWIPMDVPIPGDFEEDPVLYTLEIGPDNRKWIGTNYGLVIEDNGEWTIYTPDDIPGAFVEDIWTIAINPINGKASIGSFEWVEFDGENWTNISADSDLFFYGLADTHYDANGTLWNTDMFSQIGKWENGVLTVYQTFGTGDFLPSPPNGFFERLFDQGGDTYMVTEASEIFKFENEKWVLQTTPLFDATNSNLDFFFQDESGVQWAALKTELFHLSGNELVTETVSESGLTSNLVRGLSTDPEGVIYLVDGSSKVFFYTGDGNLSRFETPLDTFSTYSIITKAAWNDFGEYWLCTNKGVFQYEGGVWTRFHESLGNFPTFSASDIDFDHNGTPWVTTPTDTYRYDIGSASWLSITQEIGLPINDFKSIHFAPDGSAWLIQQYSDLIIRIKDGEYDGYNSSNAPWEYDEHPTRILGTTDGAIWLISSYRNLYILQNGEWIEDHPEPDASFLPIFYNLNQIDDGRIFLNSHLGLYIYNNEAWEKRDMSNAALLSNACAFSEVDKDGALWISSNGSGFQRMDGFLETTFIAKPPQINEKLALAPNPANEQIQVLIPDLLQGAKAQWTITDQLGRKVQFGSWQLSRKDERKEIYTAKLSAGWYTLSIQDGQSLWTGAFLVSH